MKRDTLGQQPDGAASHLAQLEPAPAAPCPSRGRTQAPIATVTIPHSTEPRWRVRLPPSCWGDMVPGVIAVGDDRAPWVALESTLDADVATVDVRLARAA